MQRALARTRRVSVGSGGSEANQPCLQPAISGHGRYVAIRSSASNLVPGDTNGNADVFVRDVSEARQPAPPWADTGDAMLRLLLYKAQSSMDAGMDSQVAMLQLAVHAWFEGPVENYDRGQRDARRPRAVD